MTHASLLSRANTLRVRAGTTRTARETSSARDCRIRGSEDVPSAGGFPSRLRESFAEQRITQRWPTGERTDGQLAHLVDRR